MIGIYTKHRWLFNFRGIIAILFGLAVILLPGLGLELLVLLVGAFFMGEGVLAIASSLSGDRGEEKWGVPLLEGIVGVAFGMMAIFWPQITLLDMVLLIGVWALLIGILEIIASLRLRKVICSEGFLGLSGILSLLFGIVILVKPDIGTVVLAWIIGVYAIFFGILLFALGIRLRKFQPPA